MPTSDVLAFHETFRTYAAKPPWNNTIFPALVSCREFMSALLTSYEAQGRKVFSSHDVKLTNSGCVISSPDGYLAHVPL